MPRPGESLGKYKLIRRIGMGGMAEVWLARVSGPGGFAKTLVVKTVLESQARNAEFVAQFLDEARLAALLTHPNIVQIFELGSHDGTYFIAMEYVRGQDLQDVRKRCSDRGSALPLPTLARIACGVCEGLHYAHELTDDAGRLLSLVHRDVSPENVLISYDGVVKIVDFGIAKASISQVTTRAGLFKGKLHYATPERLLGKPIDRRDDIYGLGAVLYETATGRPPINAQSEGEMVRRILDADFPRPRELDPGISEELERIILKCMAWSPDDRYGSARELQVDLERYIARSGEMATSFEVAEFMRHIFEAEVSAASGRSGAADLDESTPTRDPFEGFGDDAVEAFGAGLEGAAELELALEGDGLEDQTIESPRPVAPATRDELEPRPSRRRGGLIVAGVLAVVLAAGAAALALWAPWGDAAGTAARADAAVGGGGDSAPREAGPVALLVPDGGQPDAGAALENDAAPGPSDAGLADASEAGLDDDDVDGGDGGDGGGGPLVVAGPGGTLSLRGPAGCSARLGQARLGSLPLETPLPVGTHAVQVRCPYGVRRGLEVTIREGETTTETVRIRSGSLMLLVRPWAEVYVDGRRLGITPLGDIELSEGTHSLRLVNSEIGASRTTRVRIRPGERTTLRVRLDQGQ